jgi:NAD(P)-dependent dehydrogenase (short-subunit alcohol dehydrogenase family)
MGDKAIEVLWSMWLVNWVLWLDLKRVSVDSLPVCLFFSFLMHDERLMQIHTAAYCSAKAAIIGLTKSDALDYSQHNIRVNCVCPGVIETPLINDDVRKAISSAPMNRAGTPQEMADCILFLCSPKSSFVQGAALVADGGYTIN